MEEKDNKMEGRQILGTKSWRVLGKLEMFLVRRKEELKAAGKLRGSCRRWSDETGRRVVEKKDAGGKDEGGGLRLEDGRDGRGQMIKKVERSMGKK